jgi:glycosyltransferase involved in cell wall biosynthesis
MLEPKKMSKVENTSRKKILFISHSPYRGGAEYSLFYLLQGLDRSKYEAFVLFPRDGPIKEKVDSLGWRTLSIPMPWWIAGDHRSVRHLWRLLWRLPRRLYLVRKLIREWRIDIVYTNTICCFDGAIAAKLEGKPHIWHVREMLNCNRNMKSYMPVSLMSFFISVLSDRILVPSFAASNGLGGKKKRKNISIISNGIDLQKFSVINPKEGLRKILGLDVDAKLVAIVGYVVEAKGHLDFVDAASCVSKEMENVYFIVVGNGEKNFTNIVKNRVKESGMSDRIIFMGFRDDITMIMSAVDLVVSASWVESFGRVICEAMAAGKPVIATRCGGPEEIIVDGETGLLVPIRSPLKLADAMLKMLSDEPAAKEMGKNANRWAREHLNLEEYVANVEKEIGGLCS